MGGAFLRGLQVGEDCTPGSQLACHGCPYGITFLAASTDLRRWTTLCLKGHARCVVCCLLLAVWAVALRGLYKTVFTFSAACA